MSVESNAMKSVLAYGKIRDLIISGAKLPGTRLIVADLEEELELGRGAIREALMRLDRSGLVNNLPYKGMIVASPPQMGEIEHIYKMRCELEVVLTTEAINKLKKADFDKLEELLHSFKDLKNVSENFFSLDRAFHAIIYRASAMIHLCNIVDKMMDTIEVYLNLYHYENEDHTVFVNEHMQIVALLKAKDLETLIPILQNNIMGGLKLVHKAYGKIVHNKS